MTVQELHSWFNIMLDHYNEPYFIDNEVDQLINAGATELVNDIVFKEFFPTLGENEKGLQALNSMESIQQGAEVLQPLIVTDLSVAVSGGIASTAAIDTALRTDTGDSNDKAMHVIAVNYNNGTEDRIVRFVRHNDRGRFKRNTFKSPTARNPIYTINRNGLLIEPNVSPVKVTLVKAPRKVSIEDNITLDLPEFVHQRVIAYALSLSGVATRDDVLLQLQKLSGNGTARQ
jgi:hypothetical protein